MKTQLYLKLFATIILSIFLSSNINAQKNLENAKDLMDKYEYAEAIKEFKNYFELNTPSLNNLRDISYCYLMINNKAEASKWLKNLTDRSGATSYDIWIYARTLHSMGQYAEAIEQYGKYGSLKPEDKSKAEKYIEACRQAEIWMDNPEFYEVENVKELNSPNSDFGLIVLGEKVFFTSDRSNKAIYSQKETHGWTGNPYYKIYQTKLRNLDTGESVDDLNGEFHTGPAVYDANTNTMYFTRTTLVKQNQRPENIDPTSWMNPPSNELFTNRLEIYTSKFENGQWSEPEPFQHNRAEQYSVGHPAISPDGKTIYYVSDMPGGLGETDIYFSKIKADDSWSNPINAGKTINTEGKEMFPHIDSEGKLYFSSDGHPGMGGLDIFSAQGTEREWKGLENMRYPINSYGDDFSIYYTEPGTMAYFSSNRQGGQGNDDIYRLSWSPPETLVLAVRTLENFDGELLHLPNVKLDIVNSQDDSNTLITNHEAIAIMQADCNQTYTIKAQLENHFSQTEIITTECITKSDTLWVDVILERIVINKAIVLKNIYYDYDKWNIRPDAAMELDKLVVILKDNPEIIIELGSHTDSRGTDRYNENLSQRRAESAVEYIISQGIDSGRISAKGYGESVPVNECVDGVYCSEEDHQMNRRTEFKVTGYNYNIVQTE